MREEGTRLETALTDGARVLNGGQAETGERRGRVGVLIERQRRPAAVRDSKLRGERTAGDGRPAGRRPGKRVGSRLRGVSVATAGLEGSVQTCSWLVASRDPSSGVCRKTWPGLRRWGWRDSGTLGSSGQRHGDITADLFFQKTSLLIQHG